MTSNRYQIDNDTYITNSITNSITNEDIPSFVKYLNNPTIYANTLRIPHPYTIENGEDFIKKINSEPDAAVSFTIRLNETNELIGACDLHGLNENERIAEIGYWLGEPYWGRGLVPKVITKVIEIARSQWANLVRIEAQIFTWNKASRRVVEKCHFAYEGLLRKRVHKNGEDIDVYLYAFIIE